MESITELREKLQKNQLGHPILQRILSIYITRAILPTRVTANQVTVAMLLVGAVSAIPLFLGYIWIGIALSYLCILLDAVDGEVARYRKSYSLKGIYLDLINHLAIQAWFFLALGYAVAQTQTGLMQDVVLIAAIVGALSFPLRRANGDIHREMFVHHYHPHPERFELPAVKEGNGTQDTSSSFNLVQLAKKGVYYSEYHAVMLVVVVAALVAEMVFLPLYVHPLLSWIIVVYAAVSVAYLLKEIVGGYREIERRIAVIKKQLHHD